MALGGGDNNPIYGSLRHRMTPKCPLCSKPAASWHRCEEQYQDTYESKHLAYGFPSETVQKVSSTVEIVRPREADKACSICSKHLSTIFTPKGSLVYRLGKPVKLYDGSFQEVLLCEGCFDLLARELVVISKVMSPTSDEPDKEDTE